MLDGLRTAIRRPFHAPVFTLSVIVILGLATVDKFAVLKIAERRPPQAPLPTPTRTA